MKWLTRSFAFAASLALGVAIVPFSPELSSAESYPVVAVADPSPRAVSRQAFAPAEIRVMYAGWEHGGGDAIPHLKFMIYNGLDRPVFYTAKSPMNPMVTITSNGRPLQRPWTCGNGLEQYQILSGSSAEVRVTPFDFLEPTKKGDRLTVAFYLRPEGADGSSLYSSEPFLLPENLREAIEDRAIPRSWTP